MPQLVGFERVPIAGPRTRTRLGALRRFMGFLADPVGVVLALREYGDVVAVADENPAIVCAFPDEPTAQRTAPERADPSAQDVKP